MIQDNTGMLDEGTFDKCIQNAVVQYSKRHPQTCVIDQIVGQDAYYLTLPDNWESDYSKILNILEIVDDETFYEISPTAWALDIIANKI